MAFSDDSEAMDKQPGQRHTSAGRRASRHASCYLVAPPRRPGPQPPASRPAGAAVYLTGRTVDAAAARQPSTIGQTAVHAEDNASVASLMSHRLSPQDR